MNLLRALCIFPLMAFLPGCASLGTFLGFDNDYSKRMNPPRIHVAPADTRESADGTGTEGSKGKDADTSQARVRDAEVAPFRDYYSALENARKGEPAEKDKDYLTADRPYIPAYVDQGIGLVKAHCLRWLQRLNDEQRLLEYANTTTNVITELGTTLLGLAGANRAIVATYGGYNTARAGLTKNFNEAFLLAPNAKKVKSHIFSVLDAEGERLLQDARDKKLTFKTAYVRLERYADACTHSTAREIIETALDQTSSKLEPGSGGKIKTTATDPEGKLQLATMDAEVKSLKSVLSDRDKSMNTHAVETERRLTEANNLYQESVKKLRADLQSQIGSLQSSLDTEKKRREDSERQLAAEKQRAAELDKRLAERDAPKKAE
jgi:hypothetical protein